MAPIKSSTSGIPASVPLKGPTTAAPAPAAPRLPAPAVPDRFTSLARPANDFSNKDLARNQQLLARLQASRGAFGGADGGEFSAPPAPKKK